MRKHEEIGTRIRWMSWFALRGHFVRIRRASLQVHSRSGEAACSRWFSASDVTFGCQQPLENVLKNSENPEKQVSERWQSGRLCSTGNAVSGKLDRGFESLPLRLFSETALRRVRRRAFSFLG